MKKGFRKYTSVMVFLLVGILLFSPLFRFGAKADNTLQEGYLFLSRMQVSTATDLTVMFTPSETYNHETNPRVFRIYFPQGDSDANWCRQDDDAFSEIEGVASSPVDAGDWDIDAALPGTLAAKCYQGPAGGNDYIEVTGIGSLTGGTSYGFKIDAQDALFRTGANIGSNLISFQLTEGDDVENITFGINLIGDDQVTVTVTVEDAETIICQVGDDVGLGTLFLGGPYVIGDHTIGASSTSDYYFAVYGEGHDGEAGLYKTEATAYLLSSEPDTGDTLNLVTGEGFGLSVTSAGSATLPAKYNPSELGTGVFGAIYTDPSLLLTDSGDGSYTITLAARASVDAEPGAYTETLTYVCGVYIAAIEE